MNLKNPQPFLYYMRNEHVCFACHFQQFVCL